MISVVVRDYANAAESALFSIYDHIDDPSLSVEDKKEINWMSYAVIPVITLGNTLVETITPLLQTVESVVNFIGSALATFYFLLHFDKYAGKTAKMTMINLNETIRNVVRSIGKVALSPLYFITQLFVVAKPSLRCINPVDKEIPGSRNYLFRDSIVRQSEHFFTRCVTPNLLKGLYSGVIKIARVSPLAARVIAVFAALIDTALEVITPLITTIQSLLMGTTIMVILVVSPILKLFKREIGLRNELKYITCKLNFAVESIAQAVSMAVLAPITLIAQTAKIIYDPLHPDFIMFSIYFMCHVTGYKPDQCILTKFGFRFAKLEESREIKSIKIRKHHQ